MSKKQNEAAPAAAPMVPCVTQVLANDEHAGKGGSFVFDPVSGKRMPAVQTDPVAEEGTQ